MLCNFKIMVDHNNMNIKASIGHNMKISLKKTPETDHVILTKVPKSHYTD